MKTSGILIVVACAALTYGCGATIPKELADARLAYQHASAGPAAELAPADLHKAQEALAAAETSFSKDADSFRTLDLAYVAQRRAEIADAQASIATEQKSKAQAESAYEVAQGNLLQEKTADLNLTRTALAISESSGQATAEQLSAEQMARSGAEKRATEQRMLAQQKTQDLSQAREALAASEQSGQAALGQLATEQKARVEAERKTAVAESALAKLASKEEERGLVITLSGSVLFRSDEATLMPGAESRLDQVYDALATRSDRNVVVEGYTDSQGSDSYNLDLSQRRADAVRNYLVHRGYTAGRIAAQGVGEGRPVADNGTAEGRANNRRVEIVLANETKR